MDYERLKIKEFTHWVLYLHANQYFFGRTYIWSKRPGLVDLMDTTEEERRELFEIGNLLKTVLQELFAPDLFNWASLGNIASQCHLHVIPRYAQERHFAGETFRDYRWGQNYAPYDYDFIVSSTVLLKIRDAIREQLESQTT